jgi:hypothetical protein
MKRSNTAKSLQLRLEIDAPKISATKFRKGLNAFIELINEISKDVSGISRSVNWLVSVSPGSMRIDFTPEPFSRRTPPRIIPEIIDAIEHGLRTIEATSQRPPHFSDAALRHLRDLASLVGDHRGGLDAINIRRNGSSTLVTSKTLANVDHLVGTESQDWGSVEGRLAGVFERDGYNIWIFDDVLDKNITCNVSPELLPRVLKSFGKRVEVSGLIRYRRGGEINSITVEGFEVFPDPEKLPTFNDVYGLLRGYE